MNRVPPKEVQSIVDFGQVGVGEHYRADIVLWSVPRPVKIVSHEIRKIHVLHHGRQVKILEVEVGRRRRERDDVFLVQLVDLNS